MRRDVLQRERRVQGPQSALPPGGGQMPGSRVASVAVKASLLSCLVSLVLSNAALLAQTSINDIHVTPRYSEPAAIEPVGSASLGEHGTRSPLALIKADVKLVLVP